jgi:hypothetical protein
VLNRIAGRFGCEPGLHGALRFFDGCCRDGLEQQARRAFIQELRERKVGKAGFLVVPFGDPMCGPLASNWNEERLMQPWCVSSSLSPGCYRA